MPKCNKCEHCDANLDFGERCLCNADGTVNRKGENKQFYRIFPKYDVEQKLKQLNSIKSLLM